MPNNIALICKIYFQVSLMLKKLENICSTCTFASKGNEHEQSSFSHLALPPNQGNRKVFECQLLSY
jgi:hypothetical protein